MEGAEHPKFASKLGARDILHRGGTFLEEEAEQETLVGADRCAQLLGHGECDEVIRHGQEPCGLAVEPYLRIVMPALWAGAVPATVEGEVFVPTLASVEAAALRGSMARKDRAHRRVMRGQDVLCAKLGQVGWPVAVQDLRQCRGHRGLDFYPQAGVKDFERLTRAILAHAREVSVDDSRFDRGVAEILTDERKGDPRLQQMGGIAVTESVNGRAFADPAVSHATLECLLHAGRADVTSG